MSRLLFQNVAAAKLQRDGPIDCDVLVTGDDRAACDLVCGLCREMGFRGLYAGPLENSIATEALTSLLITINREHKVHAGIKISEVA